MDVSPPVFWPCAAPGLVTIFFQASQLVQDVVTFYCIACEVGRMKKMSSVIVACTVLALYSAFRLVSCMATYFFILAVTNPYSPWLRPLALLNVALYLPDRIITVCGASVAAFHARKSHQHPNPGSDTRDDSESKELLGHDLHDLPITLVIIPCYREPLSAILDTIHSAAASTYDSNRIHIFVSFDGFQNRSVFLELLKIAGATFRHANKSVHAQGEISGVRITLSAFEHGGKTHCQGRTMDYIREVHSNYMEAASDVSILFLDADTTICQSTLQLFGRRLHGQPPTPSKLVALTSVQGIRHPSLSWNSATQEAEYLIYSIFFQAVFSRLGNVACLAGTAVHTGVVSETEPAPSLRNLLVQRKKWFLGTVSTEAAYLSSPAFWASTPLLSAWRLCKPAVVPDTQMLAVVAELAVLRKGWPQALLIMVLSFLLADVAILATFKVVRPRVGLGTCLLGRLVAPFVTSLSIFWALLSLKDRHW